MHLRGRAVGETPQVAAAGDNEAVKPRGTRARGRLLIHSRRGLGALVRRLRFRTAAHLRVSTSANHRRFS